MLGWVGVRMGRVRVAGARWVRVLAENDNNWRILEKRSTSSARRELCPELGLELEVPGPKGLKFQNTNSKGCGVKTKISK